MLMSKVNQNEMAEEIKELRENGARIVSVQYVDGKAVIYYN